MSRARTCNNVLWGTTASGFMKLLVSKDEATHVS